MSADIVAVRRYLRTPKGLFALALALLSVATATQGALLHALPCLAASMAAAMLLDAPLLRITRGKWEFPDGALLTGWIVALVLSPYEAWYVGAATAALGIAGKHALRAGRANVLNPAAVGLLVSYFVLDTAQSWWGALPELPMPWLLLLTGTGVFITVRLGKAPLVLTYLLVYYLLATTSTFLGDPAHVSELFRAPDLHAVLFLAFFMLTDPPTSPPRTRDQLVFATIAATVGFASFELVGAVYFLLAGLLAANVWEGWRKWRLKQSKRQGVSSGGALAAGS